MITLFRIFCLLCFLISTAQAQVSIRACSATQITTAENCEDACLWCSAATFTDNSQAQPGSTTPFACGPLENDKWYSFVPNRNAMAVFTLNASGCQKGDGLQMGIYDDCEHPPLMCQTGTAGGANNALTMQMQLEQGKQYYLVVDGFGGDICQYNLMVTPSDLFLPPQIRPTSPIAGPQKVCPGIKETYSIAGPAEGATHYEWTVPADATINGLPGPGPYNFQAINGKKIEVTFGLSGGTISLRPNNICRYGPTRVLPVIVRRIPPAIFNLSLCSTQLPYELYGNIITSPGNYTFTETLTTIDGCDSMVVYRVAVKAIQQRDLGNIGLCKGETFSFCGKTYSAPGQYSVNCTGGCDTLYTFSIVPKEATVSGAGSLNCFNNAVTLRADAAQGKKVWKNAAGQIVGTADTLVVTSPGKYLLEWTDTLTNPLCTFAKEVLVPAKDTLRLQTATATLPVLTCTRSSAEIAFTTNMPAVLDWPGSPQKPALNHKLTIAQGGTFSVRATTIGGCTALYAGLIQLDTVKPQIQAFGDTISCLKSAGNLRAIATTPGVGFLWKGVNLNFTASGNSVFTNRPGLYEVVATRASNGCTRSLVREVVDNGAPRFAILPEYISCGNPTATLVSVPLNNLAQVAYSWAGPNGFASTAREPEAPRTGTYNLTTTNLSNGCTATYTAVVVENTQFFPLPPLLRTDTLSCTRSAIVLSIQPHLSMFTGLEYRWRGPNAFASTLPNPSVTVPGTYAVTVTGVGGRCTATSTLVVTENINPPTAQATGGTLPCKPAVLTLRATTNVVNATFFWLGPGGFSSTLREPTVSQFGTYRVTVTNTLNQCTAVASATVNASPGGPYVSLSLVTVAGSVRRIQCTTTAFQPAFEWKGPNGFTSTVRNPVVVLPGVYTVRVTDASTGCETYRSITVPPLQTPAEAKENTTSIPTEVPFWAIVPNPATHLFRVHFEAPADEPVQLRLLDATGRVILTQQAHGAQDTEWNVAALPSGAYWMVVLRGAGVEAKQVLVE